MRIGVRNRWKVLKLNWELIRVVYIPITPRLLLLLDLSTANTSPRFIKHHSGRIRFGLIQRTEPGLRAAVN